MPDSATTLLCGGYTTAGFLGIGAGSIPTKISLTNYSATLRNTLIQSQAMLHQALDVNTVKRTKNAFILGVPTITCDISFEVEFSLLNGLFSMLKNKRNDVLKAKITDKASGIAWDFDECYLQSFSFGVQQDTILSANLSLFVQPNTISYSYTNRSLIDIGNDTVIPLIQPIPYYSWKVGDIEDIKTKKDKLNETAMAFATKVYEEAAKKAQAEQSDTTESDKKDDVQDAEFEEK